jgi:hypothetical protein
MVFDSVRGRFVLQTTRTCEWDGVDWRERTTLNHPTANGAFGLAFDSARGRTVLFGGGSTAASVPTPLQELWEYDGIDWTRRTFSGGPSGRFRPAMAYDVSHHCTVIYGGDAVGSLLSDTWTWDGTTWRSIPGSGPAQGVAMAFHLPTARMVLCGAASNGTPETWTFDGASWRRELVLSPAARSSAAMCEDVANGVVRLFGQVDTSMWEWNGLGWTSAPTPLSLRQQGAMASDPFGTTLVHGGLELVPFIATLMIAGPATSDTWRLHAGNWTQLHGSGPPSAIDTTMTHDLLRDRVLCTAIFSQERRTYTWSRDEWSENAGARLPALFGARGCHDPQRDRLILFGGGPLTGFDTVSQTPVNNLFEYDGVQWTQIAASGPAPRAKHSFAFDLARGEAVMFGGHGSAGNLGDTWAWNGAQWRLLSTSGPSPRYAAAMTADISHSCEVLFGGTDGTISFGDTWLWNGQSWQLVQPAVRPPNRSEAGFDFDLARQRAVLVGGSPTNTDQWEWDGSVWTRSPDPIADRLDLRANSAIAFAGNGMLRVANVDSWLGVVTTATVTRVGSSCGAPAPTLVALGQPVLGSTSFAVELHRSEAGAPFVLGIGAGPAATSLGAGCTLLLQSLELTTIGFADATGHAAVTIPVPAVPTLRGINAALQIATLQPAAPLGFALTNGLSARIGD